MIYCKIPRAGLGNQLFIIAHALMYSRINSKPIIFLGYKQIKIGPYLRFEKSKRDYSNFFIFHKNLFGYSVDMIRYRYHKFNSVIVIEPSLIPEEVNSVVLFNNIPHWSDFFGKLKTFGGKRVREEILSIVTDENKKIINNLPLIDVAVHVRLGDFKKLNSSVDFAKVGSTRTPLEYFQKTILLIKSKFPQYKFKIFTDGYENEVSELLTIDSVDLYESVNDLVDLFQMSNSKILITSAGSTYSYWAGFLGNCEIIQHPDHIHNLN
jgi:hypothetical protein